MCIPQARELLPGRRPDSCHLPGRLGRLALALLLSLSLALDARAETPLESWNRQSKEDKVLYSNLAVAAAITAWGVFKWDYFQTAPTAYSEGWFGSDTREGGADKLGHLWVAYAGSHALGGLYRSWGYGEREAGTLGSLTSLGLTTLMEVGDSLSGKYGFSYEDALMNTAGAGLGYLLWTHPEIARWVDLRVEWRPNSGSTDPFTDYENLKYLAALKLDAVPGLRSSPLRFLELHAGYYARGYSSTRTAGRERNLYLGVGLNLSRLFSDSGHPRISRALNYFQIPYTYVSARTNLND